MVVDTRSTTTMTTSGALEHVLGNVLGYPDDHQVRLALNYFGVTDINALTIFKDDDFTLLYLSLILTTPPNKLNNASSRSSENVSTPSYVGTTPNHFKSSTLGTT